MKNKRIVTKIGLFLAFCFILLLILPDLPVQATEEEQEMSREELAFIPETEYLTITGQDAVRYYSAVPEYSWKEEFLDVVRRAMEAGESSVSFWDIQIPEEYRTAMGDVLNASVEGMFVDIYTITASEGYINSATLYYNRDYEDDNGEVDLSDLLSAYTKARRAVENILLVASGMSDIEKVLYVHDWLVEQTDYAYEEYLAGQIQWVHYSARGPLVENKAVCSGYAATFSMLMQQLGVNVCEVSSGGMNHAWNLVELDGEWYHVDATWDDPVYNSFGGDYWSEGTVRHTYFLKSDEEFLGLEHYDWWLSWAADGTEDTPAAPHNGAFTDELFYGRASGFGYKDGKWCYTVKNQVVQCNYTGEEMQVYRHNSWLVNGVLVDDTYFFADDEAVYSIPCDEISEDAVATTVYEANGYIEEFAVKDGTAIVVYWNSDAGEYVRECFSLASELNLSSINAKYCVGTVEVGEEIDTEKLLISAYTVNGYQVPIPVGDCSFGDVDTGTPGEKLLYIEFEGIEYELPIRVAYSLNGEYELDVTEYVYTGKPIEPVPVVYYGNRVLQPGQDYSLSYRDNCVAGTATVTVTGLGNYRGSFSVSYEILKKEITEADVEVFFPELDVTYDNLWELIYERLLVRVNGVVLSADEYWTGSVWYRTQGDTLILSRIELNFDNYLETEEDEEELMYKIQITPFDWEGINSFVTRLYNLILDRNPDADGLNTWTNLLLDKERTGVGAAEGFILSDEFLNKEMSGEEFVKIMYRTFLGREADEGGLTTWLGLMEQGYSKTFIFAGFANSDEFQTVCDSCGIERGFKELAEEDKGPETPEDEKSVRQFVKRLYNEILGRGGDTEGMNTWVTILESKERTGAEVAEGFILSEEFLAKDMTSAEFVTIMYRTFFGREADSEGFNTWVSLMSQGYTERFVFAGFANSDEFSALCAEYGIERGTVAAE